MATLNDIFTSKSKNVIPAPLQKRIDVALAELNHANKEHIQEIAVVLATKYGVKKTAQLIKILHGVNLGGKKDISKKAKALLKKETASFEVFKAEEVEKINAVEGAVRNERLKGGQGLRQETNVLNTMFDSRVLKDSPLLLHERAQGAINAMEYASREDLPTILKELTPFYGEEEARSIVYEMTGVHLGDEAPTVVKQKKVKPGWVEIEMGKVNVLLKKGNAIDIPSVTTDDAVTALVATKTEKIKEVVDILVRLKESVGAVVEAVEAVEAVATTDDGEIIIE